MDQPKKLDSASPAAEAREQAKAYDSLFANQELDLPNGGTIEIPPHPDFGMLDDDRQEAYEELVFETESYDREPDIFIPEHYRKDKDGKDTGPLQPAETLRGELKRPFRKTDSEGIVHLIKPPYSVRVVQAALGAADYARLKAGGGSAADVWKVWARQGAEVRSRLCVVYRANALDYHRHVRTYCSYSTV